MSTPKPAQPKLTIEERLTERDRMILHFLGEYGCVTPSRIKAQFWNTNDKSCAHYRRISLLKKGKLVESVVGDHGLPLGIRLTKKGQRMVRRFPGNTKPLVNRRAYKTPFEHDQMLIDIRRILEKSPVLGNFKAEATLRHELTNNATKLLHWENAPLIPDATFLLSNPQNKLRMALELELTIKSKRRYRRIFRHHLLSKNWQLVLYIVKDEAAKKRLMEILKGVKEKDLEIQLAKEINAIYFCSLTDFRSKGLAAPMTNGKREISFAELDQSTRAVPTSTTTPT